MNDLARPATDSDAPQGLARAVRTLAREALALWRGAPAPTGVPETRRAAFQRFADGLALRLAPEEEAILARRRSAVAGACDPDGGGVNA